MKNSLSAIINLLFAVCFTQLAAQDCNLTKQQQLLLNPDRIGYGRNATGGTNVVYVDNEADLRIQLSIDNNYVCLAASLANQQIGLTKVAYVGNNITFDGSEAPGAEIFPDYANGFPPSPNQTSGNPMFSLNKVGGSNVIFHAIKLNGRRSAEYVEGNQDYNTGGINIRISDVWMNHVEATGFWDDVFLVARAGDRVTLSNVKTYNTDKSVAGFFPDSGGPVNRHITIHKSDLSCSGVSGGQRSPSTTANFVHLFNSYIHGFQYGAVVAESNSVNIGRMITENNVYEDTHLAPERTRDSGIIWSNGNHIYGMGNNANAVGNVIAPPQAQPFTVNYSYTLMKASEVKNYVLQNAGAIVNTANCNPVLPTGCPTEVVTNGNVSFEEPLPAGGINWVVTSPFWSCNQNGNSFDVTPYLSTPNPYAFTLTGLPPANYCCNFEGYALDANDNQLPAVYNQCCFTVETQATDTACPDSPVEVNTNFTITANTNSINQNCTWTQNGHVLNDITGNTLTTKVVTAGTYNFEATCCITGSNNGNSILPLQTQITAEDDPGQPTIPVPPKCVWIDHPGRAGVEIMRINDGTSENVFGHVHQYSRRSAFTADGKYFAMNDGRLISVEDCSVKCNLGTSSEFVLSQLDPNIAFGWSGSNFYKVYCNDVNNKELLFSAPTGLDNYTIGRWEGQQDFNDKYILLEYGDTAVILDLETGITGSTFYLNNLPGNFNWADVSANGTYALVGTSVGVYRFNTPNFTNQTQLNIGNRTGNWHFDMMYDASGNEIAVMEGIGAPSTPQQDWAYNVLATNEYITVDALSGGGITAQSHVSGQAKNRPGWVYISGGTQTYPNNYLFSMEVKPNNNQIEYWGSTYTSLNAAYKAEPKASVSPSGEMVVVSTNWNVNGGPVYEILYRPKNFVPQQQCETFSCLVTVVETNYPNNQSGIYEAEAATLVGVNKANNKYTNVSNGEYVTGFDEDGDELIFNNVYVAEAGTYALTIRYACTSYKENYVIVNTGNRENISFPTATVLTDKTISVNLNEGNNIITIDKHWGWFDVDYIKIDETGNEEPPQPGSTIRIEAELGVSSGVITQNNTSASAGQYVTNFIDEGDKLTVTAQVENGGMYHLKVGYRSESGEKKNDIYLNGMFLGNIQFLQSNTFIEMTVGDFYFNAGPNTIEFIKNWGWMDLDYFELVAVGNQNGNSFNDVCNRTVEIGNPPTASYYRAGVINSDATISENHSIQFIGTEAVNLKNGFEVEKGGDFITGIERCE